MQGPMNFPTRPAAEERASDFVGWPTPVVEEPDPCDPDQLYRLRVPGHGYLRADGYVG